MRVTSIFAQKILKQQWEQIQSFHPTGGMHMPRILWDSQSLAQFLIPSVNGWEGHVCDSAPLGPGGHLWDTSGILHPTPDWAVYRDWGDSDELKSATSYKGDAVYWKKQGKTMKMDVLNIQIERDVWWEHQKRVL